MVVLVLGHCLHMLNCHKRKASSFLQQLDTFCVTLSIQSLVASSHCFLSIAMLGSIFLVIPMFFVFLRTCKDVRSKNMTKANSATLPEGAQVVLDGGSLLHRIVWNRGSTFESILNAYTNYVNRKYGKPVVVFDGYQGSTIKDMTHKRRSKSKHGMTVTFEKSMNLAVTKEVFLSNKENKQRFIIMLGEELSKSGCTVFHATGDVNCLLVKKAIAVRLRTSSGPSL